MFFTCVFKTVLVHNRPLGICVHAYLDNWLQPSVRTPCMATQQGGPGSYSEPRLHSQLGEIRTGTSSELQLFRCQVGSFLDRLVKFAKSNNHLLVRFTMSWDKWNQWPIFCA